MGGNEVLNDSRVVSSCRSMDYPQAAQAILPKTAELERKNLPKSFNINNGSSRNRSGRSGF